jgi:hypothetical protein
MRPELVEGHITVVLAKLRDVEKEQEDLKP